MSEIETLLDLATKSGRPVSSDLLPLIYEELRVLAAQQLSREAPGQTLQATALVHEAWLRLAGDANRSWSDRAHFFRAAAQAMRRILVDRARGKASLKRRVTTELLDIDGLDIAAPALDQRILLVDEMMDRLEMEDPESARVVSLKFFGGLANKEIASMDGVTERTIERQWAYAKARLFQMIRQEAKTGAVEK